MPIKQQLFNFYDFGATLDLIPPLRNPYPPFSPLWQWCCFFLAKAYISQLPCIHTMRGEIQGEQEGGVHGLGVGLPQPRQGLGVRGVQERGKR